MAGALLLRLLVVWLTDCPAAISALLAGASHLPLLVDLVTGRVGAGGPGSKADAPVAGEAGCWSASLPVLLCALLACSPDTHHSAAPLTGIPHSAP